MVKPQKNPDVKERPIVALIVVCLLLGITYGLVKRAISPRWIEVTVALTPDDSPDHRPSLWESEDLYLEVERASNLPEEGLSFKGPGGTTREWMTTITFEGDQVLITMRDWNEDKLVIVAREYPLAYQRLLTMDHKDRIRAEIETIDVEIIEQEDVVFPKRKALGEALLLIGAPTNPQGILSPEAFEEFWTSLPESEREAKVELATAVREARQEYEDSLALLTKLRSRRKEAQDQLENWQPPGIESGQPKFRTESFWKFPGYLLASIIGGSIVFTGVVLTLTHFFLWRGASGDKPTPAEPVPDDPADVW